MLPKVKERIQEVSESAQNLQTEGRLFLPACQARDSHDRAVLIGTARYYLEGRLVGRQDTLA